MDKTYQPQPIEIAATALWNKLNAFAPTQIGQPYCIMLPPPNVTGSLHMGHGFQQTLMDVLIRYHRMQGYNTLWQGGTDHAGIATQMVVERQLNIEGKTRHDLGRETFLKRVWAWKAESGGTIGAQMRRLGASVDWSRDRFTMDKGLSLAVRKAFIELYREGLIYRGKRLVNWDVHLQTAVSDLEVLTQEQDTHLWHLHYPLANGKTGLIVATTRPETLFGDMAVAIHPEDERYQDLIGQSLQLPLCNRLIPVIADASVEQTFGTGCVKITPAHDFNDYAMAERHALPLLNVLTPDGKMNDEVPQSYRGLDRFEARQKLITDLKQLGVLVKTEDYKQQKPIGERSGTILEPFLTDQWFVKAKPLAEPAIQAVLEGKIRFIPDHAKNLYFEWMNHIQDWCISRQLWWGHRIPAWYDEAGQAYVGHDEADVRQHYALSDQLILKQDEDVLDTWFSSALWPFSTLGWPENTIDLQTFYPTAVLVTGFDIIFFWVARMVMFALKFMRNIPFKDVYVHGLIRDHEGQKMSKSKGNVLDPVDLIDGIHLDDLLQKRVSHMMQPRLAEKIQKATKTEFPNGIAAFGADALRLTFCSLATTSREICFDIGRVEGYRNFCNKLWNAARFVLMQIEQSGPQLPNWHVQKPVHLIDRYFSTRLYQTLITINAAIAEYRFDWITQALYELVWNEYCDFYLECAKVILNQPIFSDQEKEGTLHAIVFFLETLLRALHPLIPFITEEIWQAIKVKATDQSTLSICQTTYPQANDYPSDPLALRSIQFLKTCIARLRNLRSEMNISPSRSMKLIIEGTTIEEQNLILSMAPLLQSLCKIEHLSFLAPQQTPPPAATCLIEHMILHIPLADLINPTEESERLLKQVFHYTKEKNRLEQKLQQPQFLSHAPAAVVAEEQQKLALTETHLQQLAKQLAIIKQL